MVVIACVCLTAACGESSSTKAYEHESLPNGDPDPAAACSLPCRVVASGLTRPTELTAGGGYVYFVERGNVDSFDGVVMRAPAGGGPAQTLTAAPGILGLLMNRTSLFWTHLEPLGADYTYAIATVPNTGGTPADLFKLPTGLNAVGVDDVAVYGATQSELLAVSLADRTTRTLAQVWALGGVAVTGSTLTLTNRGHAMPPESALSDPAGTAPCLVDAVAKGGGSLATLYTAPPALLGSNCNPTIIEAFDGGVVWMGPGTDGATTSLWKLGAGAAAPIELARGISNDYGQLITNATAAYFTYRTPNNDTVFARCSTTGDITTLWSGPIQPFGIAVDETSLYVATSQRSDDGLRAHGALLALPAR
jgi:hypothetical protein